MNTSKDSNKRNVSIDERANRVGSDSADYDSCHILKDDKESRDETGGVTVRRGSIASTASEGRGTQRVKRVFTSTLSQWKQFQGSLGSLTNSLRRHYHQKISRGQSLKEDGEEQVSNSREVTQSQADDKHSREVCLAEKSLELCVDLEPSVEWKSSFKYALDKTEECDIVSVPASQEERVNIISKTEESKKLNDSDMNNEKDECRHSVRTLSSVVVSLSSCAVAGEELTKSNSSGSSSSDGGDASIQSFLSVIPKVPERKNSSASREKSDIMEGTNLEEIASGKEPVMMDLSEPSSFDTIEEDFDPGMKKTSESQKGALVNTGKDNTVTPQFNGRGQQSRKNSKQSRSSDSMEDEPRPKRLNVDLDKDYTKSTPICHSTPLSVNVQLDILNTRRLFCEGMLGSETTLRSSTEDITGERKCLEDENSDMASALHENTLEPLHDHEIFQRGIIDSFNIESATSDKDSIEIELGTCDNENIAVIENVDSNDCTSKRIIMDAHDETIVDAPDLGNAAPAVSSKCDVEGGGGVEGENAQLMLVSAASDSPVSQKASSSYQRVCQDDESASGVQDTEEAHIQDTAEAHILDTEEAHIQDTDKECSSSLDLKDYEETVVNEINVEEFLSESEKEKARNTELKLLNFEKTDDTENEEILGIAEEDGISENILDFPTMAGPKIVVTGAVGSALNSGIPPTIVLESGSVGSGGGASMEEINIAAHADALPSSSLSNLAPTQFGGAHPRPPTPKSPITVDEWVAALPHPSSIEDEGDVWAGCEQGLEDQGEDLLSLGDEAGFMAGSSSLCPASSSTTVGRNKTIDSRESPIDSHVSGAQNLESLTSAGAGNSSYVPDILGPLVLPQQQQHYREQVLSPTHKNRPVTLTDGKNVIQRQLSPKGGLENRRSQFASLKDKQTSFQSDLSGLSLQSRSSIDSLLEARQADPVDVLLNLGFGSQSQEGIARIPERFMKPSQVPGNNIDELIKSEDNFSDMMDSTEWMSGLDPQALRRSSVATVSPFISQLIESRRENRLRFMQKKNDLPSAPSPKPLTGASRFASVAKQLGMKSTVMNTFAATTNKLTVLNPENRRLLDLQGQKSPEVPRKRLIIGQSSFDLGRDGELLDVAGSVKEVVSESADSVTEEEKVDDYSSDGDDDDDLDDYRCSRHLSLRHKESVWSMASSATSVDSSEEELRDQRRRLQLILNRRPTPPETPGTPSSQGDPVDSPTFACSVTENERRRKLMRRLSLSKRVSTVSSGGSWELDEKIPEEDSEDVSNLQEQVIKESDAFISAISSSNCDILAQCSKAFCDNSDIPTVFNTNLTARTFTNDKALQTQPLQNIPNHSELGARLDTQRCHHSLPMAFVEPSSNLLMGKGERSYAEDEGKSRSQHRACSSLKRQECIDDVYSDNYPLSYRSTVMQQPSKLHMPHHIMKDLVSMIENPYLTISTF
ncbi:hypothetical protein SK128_027642 [Halocaridina rubra]|uniref:ITPR-interacting domain-containing protein n=1 Tax=Halocaridina rubra TaxID=373956 RepID=A0AAN9AF91_HALRR